ncbi:MAG TPA: hypothetical protein VG388_09420 [Solirubrobacteraceae bacterium]|jgi:hypothetical protein|nr:hypothetical protein [Solirubrobacteraceae bacterium]
MAAARFVERLPMAIEDYLVREHGGRAVAAEHPALPAPGGGL